MTIGHQAIEISNDQHKELRRRLGTWLRERREEAGLTQSELAKRLGLKLHTSISQVENGIGRIPQSLYLPWALEIGVDPDLFARVVLEHIEPGLHAILKETLSTGATRRD